MIQAYPDITSGRFLIIADFENPNHLELFQLASESSGASRLLDRKKGRPLTGTSCLLFKTAAPGDTLIISNATATQWFLKRDWRPYDLLLLSVHAPKDHLSLELTVGGGSPRQELATTTTIQLLRGWNLLRLDLAEIGEHVPLDDIREIRLAISGSPPPIEIHLDDILLTAGREVLLGDSETADSDLRVERIGRRWHVGSSRKGSEFELTFANGRIVAWYNTAADPHKLRNLVRGTSLGPNPVLVDASGLHRPLLEEFGKAVVVRSRIVELSAVRAVITSELRFADDARSAGRSLDDRPFHRWVYTIYPTGQLYVDVTTTTATRSQTQDRLGLTVSVAPAADGFRSFAAVQSSEDETAGTPPYGFLRGIADGATALFVVDDFSRSFRIVKSARSGGDSPGMSTASLIAVGDPANSPTEHWTCHLFLGATGATSDAELRARALDYTRPGSVRFEMGSYAASETSTAARPGFDSASGCRVVDADEGRIRFTLDGSRQPFFSPSFRIVDTRDRDAWVYVDHLILDAIARDAHGNLLFQIPGTIDGPKLVEVLFRRWGAPSQP